MWEFQGERIYEFTINMFSDYDICYINNEIVGYIPLENSRLALAIELRISPHVPHWMNTSHWLAAIPTVPQF